MPIKLFKFRDGRFRIDLDRLYPLFREAVFQALAASQERGAWYYAQYGWRSFAEQAELHAKWRRGGGGGRAAQAGLSAHQYGLAVDFARDADPGQQGLQLTPSSWKEEAFIILGEEVQRVGLVWGNTFNDSPHVQWPGYVSKDELQPLRDFWERIEGDDLHKLAETWRIIK